MRTSLVRSSPWRKVEQKAGGAESSSLLVKKLVAGRDVPYLLCRCRVAINWAEFTAVEKRHTANIIHRTRPVIWCRFATENRILSRTRRDSRKISREPNEFPQFDSFSQKHLLKNSFVRVDFPTHIPSKEYRFLLDQNRAYFLMFVESKFYLERERNGKFVFGKFDGGKTN